MTTTQEASRKAAHDEGKWAGAGSFVPSSASLVPWAYVYHNNYAVELYLSMSSQSFLLDWKVCEKPDKYYFYSYVYPYTQKSVLHRVGAKKRMNFKLLTQFPCSQSLHNLNHHGKQDLGILASDYRKETKSRRTRSQSIFTVFDIV